MKYCNIRYISGLQGEKIKYEIMNSYIYFESDASNYFTNKKEFLKKIFDTINPKILCNADNIDGFIDIMGDSGMWNIHELDTYWFINNIESLNTIEFREFIELIHLISSRSNNGLSVIIS